MERECLDNGCSGKLAAAGMSEIVMGAAGSTRKLITGEGEYPEYALARTAPLSGERKEMNELPHSPYAAWTARQTSVVGIGPDQAPNGVAAWLRLWRRSGNTDGYARMAVIMHKRPG